MNRARWPDVYKLRGHVGRCRCSGWAGCRGFEGCEMTGKTGHQHEMRFLCVCVCFKMVWRWGEVCNDLMVIAVSGMDLSLKRPWVLRKLVNLGRNPAGRQKSWTTSYGQFMGFVLLAIRFMLSPWRVCFPRSPFFAQKTSLFFKPLPRRTVYIYLVAKVSAFATWRTPLDHWPPKFRLVKMMGYPSRTHKVSQQNLAKRSFCWQDHSRVSGVQKAQVPQSVKLLGMMKMMKKSTCGLGFCQNSACAFDFLIGTLLWFGQQIFASME